MQSMELIVEFPQARMGQSSYSIPKKPSVSFADDLDVEFVENYAHEYKYDLHYSAQEIMSFKLQTALLQRRMRAQGEVEGYGQLLMDLEDSTVFLGLESCLTDSIYRKVLHRRAVCHGAVLSEQQRQLNVGIVNPLAIASISKEQSGWSRRRAQAIGMLHSDKK